MPHRAIVGQTGSGKTFAAQQIARDAVAAGRGVLVLHKPREPWPLARSPLVWQTHDPSAFKRMYWRARSCMCFMELSDAKVEKSDAEFHLMFEQGRHEGHRNFYLSQRAAKVHPNIRENCESLMLFSVPMKGAKLWAEEFNDDALLGAVNLPPRWFYFKTSRFTPAQLMTLQ